MPDLKSASLNGRLSKLLILDVYRSTIKIWEIVLVFSKEQRGNFTTTTRKFILIKGRAVLWKMIYNF